MNPPCGNSPLLSEFCGGSAARRQALLKRLELPEHLTTGGMLEALNLLYDRESLCRLLEKEQI